MERRRIYLALTYAQVRRLADERELAPPLRAWAAGSAGRVDARITPVAAQDEAEFIAFRAAADDSPIGADGAAARRVVASADMPVALLEELEPTSGSGPPAPLPVVVTDPIGLRSIVSLHVGEEEAGALEDSEPDLLWYDVTELAVVLAELGV